MSHKAIAYIIIIVYYSNVRIYAQNNITTETVANESNYLFQFDYTKIHIGHKIASSSFCKQKTRLFLPACQLKFATKYSFSI